MLKNIIRFELFSVKPEDSADQVVQLMKQKNVGSVLVCDSNQKPVGIVTDRDLVLRCMGQHKDARQCQVKDLMTPAPRVIKETDGIYDCIDAMHDGEIRRLPVVNSQGKAVGIVSFGDLLSILSKEFSRLTARTTHPLERKEFSKKTAAA
ncbi:MAG: CBS domain-containing protein [Bdellovibrionales bacterium]|nr:CBS domain-containing protein [Bdellovibrionales bacterium]